jgi:hypothetical protein
MEYQELTHFERLLEDTPNSAQYMDITELKVLYYGRLDMYGSFSNDEKLETSGIDKNGDVKRPSGVSLYDVRDIVGRTVNSNKFYVHVARVKPRGGKLLNMESYGVIHFNRDIEKLKQMIDEDYITELVHIVNRDARIRYEGERIWKLTKMLSEPYNREADTYWAGLLEDLNYYGIQDNKGIISKDRKPVLYIFNEKDLTVYDIVPVQKYKKDKRMRTIERIAEKTKRMYVDRSRVAQRKTEYSRDVRKKHNFRTGE